MKQKLLLLIFTFLSIGAAAQNNDGDKVFEVDSIHTIRLDFPQTGYWDSLTNYYSLDKDLLCKLTINGVVKDSVGVKFKGNSSYNNPSKKKSFKIDLNEFVKGQDYNDLKKFNLNNGFKDPTLIREKLTLDFCKALGIPAPRCTYAKLYLNGAYWGLYMLVEEINNSFLDDEFGDTRGNLFKGDPKGDLAWLGSSASMYYSKYELHNNETVNNWNDLVNLINKINNSPANSYADSLEKVLDVDNFLKGWVVSNIFANLDSYIGSGHNYFIYHDSITDKFKWITWDVNESFGNFNMGMSLTQLKSLSITYTSNNRPLCTKILANTALKTKFINTYCDIFFNYFNETTLGAKIDSLANRIRNDVYADPNKTYTNQQFETNLTTDLTLSGQPGGGNIAGLKSFLSSRSTSLTSQLNQQGCFAGISSTTTNNAILLYPNPTRETIQLLSTEVIKQYQIFNIYGELILQGSETQINISHLASGTYFVRVNMNQNLRFTKVD